MNLTYLLNLSDGDTDFVRDMLETYLTELPKDITQLQKSAQSKDLKSVGMIAHRMKSHFNTLSLSNLADLVLDMENKTKQNNTDWQGYGLQIEQLSKEIEVLYSEIKKYLSN